MIHPPSSYNYAIKSVKMRSAVFIWIEFLLATIFPERWIKFRTLSMTLKTGRSVGKLIFKVFKSTEIAIIISLIVSAFYEQKIDFYKEIIFIIPGINVLIQLFYLLPQVQRVTLLLQNQMLMQSNLHYYFVGVFETNQPFYIWNKTI